jgi:transposase-like protein
MARPSKLTSSVQQAICDALTRGASLAGAAAHAGVAESTVFEWLARGRGTDRRRASRRYVGFAYAVDAATARANPGESGLNVEREFAELAEQRAHASTCEHMSDEGFAELAEPEFPHALEKESRAREPEPSTGIDAIDRRALTHGIADRVF